MHNQQQLQQGQGATPLQHGYNLRRSVRSSAAALSSGSAAVPSSSAGAQTAQPQPQPTTKKWATSSTNPPYSQHRSSISQIGPASITSQLSSAPFLSTYFSQLPTSVSGQSTATAPPPCPSANAPIPTSALHSAGRAYTDTQRRNIERLSSDVHSNRSWSTMARSVSAESGRSSATNGGGNGTNIDLPIASSIRGSLSQRPPVVKLTVHLVQTYVAISQGADQSSEIRRKKNVASHSSDTATDPLSSKRPKTSKPLIMSSSSLTSRAPLPGSIGTKNSGFDDDKDDYIFRQGEVWEDRLHMLRQLGRGSFGQVFEAYDKLKSEHVAIKVIKNRKSFFNQAQTEIRILECLNSKDPDDTKNIVRMKEYFTHRNHLCIIYEKLSHNLYEVLRKVAFEGLSLYLVRRIASQILTTLKLLARPDVQVIHCDLKPENILLRDPTKSNIKVIDFGSSCFCKERTYSYIQSRFYRSPEVIIGHPYTVAIDMWSLGCILVELFCGAPLFCGQSEHDQMFHICDMLGLPPTDFLDKGQPQKVSKIFTRTRSASNSEVGQYRLIPSKESRSGRADEAVTPSPVRGSGLMAKLRHHFEKCKGRPARPLRSSQTLEDHADRMTGIEDEDCVAELAGGTGSTPTMSSLSALATNGLANRTHPSTRDSIAPAAEAAVLGHPVAGEEDARRQPTASIQGSSLVSYPASVRHSNSSDWVDFTSFVDLVEKMLVFEPSARITPDEALRHPFILRLGLNGG